MLNQLHTCTYIDAHLGLFTLYLISPLKVLITLKVEKEVRTGSNINAQHTAQADRIFQIDRYVQAGLLHINTFHFITSLRIQQSTVHT